MRGKSLDIIAIGSLAMDCYLLVDTLSWKEEKVRAFWADYFPGGTMGNFACASAKLGAKTGFIGIVGQDLWGERLFQEFKALGVDTTHIVQNKSQFTPVTVLIYDREGKRINLIPPFPPLQRRDIASEYIAKGKLLHTHLFDVELIRLIVQEAKKHQVTLSIDMEIQRLKQMPAQALKEILSLCDLVFINQEALAWMRPGVDIETAARWLKEEGPQAVIVTLGERGSLAVTSRESIRVQAFTIKAVDPTSGGDAFAAAFCLGWLKGWSLRKTMEFASATSALAVSKIGARTGLPTFEEVTSFMKNMET